MTEEAHIVCSAIERRSLINNVDQFDGTELQGKGSVSGKLGYVHTYWTEGWARVIWAQLQYVNELT